MVTPLKTERLRRGITTEELAIAIRTSQPTVSRIENFQRRCTPELAKRLAKHFDNAVTRDQILYPEDYVDQGMPPKKPIRQRLQKAS